MARPIRKLTIGSWQFPLIGGKARVKQFDVLQTADGLVFRQRLTGVEAELIQQKAGNTVQLRMPSVFGRPKLLTIGADWVKIGDRLFKAAPSGTAPTTPGTSKKGKGP